MLLELFSDDEFVNYANEVAFCSGIQVCCDEKSLNLLSQIYFQLCENDSLPQKICRDCLDKVLSACELKRQCIETDRLLRQHLKDDPDDGVLLDHFRKNVEGVRRLDKPIDDFPNCKSESKANSDEVDSRHRTRDLDEEARSRAKDQDLKCFICEKIFDKVCARTSHIKKDHDSELTCRVCNSKKPSAVSTEKCLRDHKLGFNYLCQVSELHYFLKDNLNLNHFSIHRSAQSHFVTITTCRSTKRLSMPRLAMLNSSLAIAVDSLPSIK